MTFSLMYADAPLLAWTDGEIVGNEQAVELVHKRITAGGTVPGAVVNSAETVGLGEARQAYATICAALTGTRWDGMWTVVGDIGGPYEHDDTVVY